MGFKLKVYPRLKLDISFQELLTSYGSGFDRSARSAHVKEIQSAWLNHLQKTDRSQTPPEILVTLSVRTAFDLLLQSLKLPPGSEVLMSAVTIRHMVEIVERHHLIPVPIDINLATLAPAIDSLNAAISVNSKVLVIAHLFGSIINLDPYIGVCQQHKILLVEDCAQAFAGSSYTGHPEADISLFSFGPIKSCTALGGAITTIKDKQLAETMQALEQTYPAKSEVWFYVRVSKYLWLKLLSVPWIYGSLLILIQALGKDLDATINATSRGFSQGDILAKIRYRLPHGMMALLGRRLCEGDRFPQKFTARALTAHKFLALLKPNIIYPGHLAGFHSFWLVHVLTEHPEVLMMRLRENGFDTTKGTTSLIPVTASHHAGIPLPTNAVHLLKHGLCLPVSPSLPEAELIRLATLINEFSESKLAHIAVPNHLGD